MLEVELSTLELRQETALHRRSLRPADARPANFDEQFDARTVFYDCFTTADGDWIVLVGPPLVNLGSAVIPSVRRAFQQKWWNRYRIRRLDRCDLLWLRSSSRAADLGPSLFRQQQIKVQPNHCRTFEGRKVLLTKNKNNELNWIRDWVEFHVRQHGCDSVLLYDNGSTKYSSRDVRAAMERVRGVEVCIVVDWPYKFGPQGWDDKYWELDFCQYGVLEHARWRFLSLATLVVNGDVDELLITKDREPISELLLRSRYGYLHYGGRWIENVSSKQDEDRRHVDFVFRSRDSNRIEIGKWTVAPQRTKDAEQWKVHEVTGIDSDKELSEAVSYRHFRSINTNWKSKRWQPVEFDDSKHVIDEELLPWLDAFGEGPGHAAISSRDGQRS